MTVEMPAKARYGEQIGVRVAIFNYWDDYFEVRYSFRRFPVVGEHKRFQALAISVNTFQTNLHTKHFTKILRYNYRKVAFMESRFRTSVTTHLSYNEILRVITNILRYNDLVSRRVKMLDDIQCA